MPTGHPKSFKGPRPGMLDFLKRIINDYRASRLLRRDPKSWSFGEYRFMFPVGACSDCGSRTKRFVEHRTPPPKPTSHRTIKLTSATGSREELVPKSDFDNFVDILKHDAREQREVECLCAGCCKHVKNDHGYIYDQWDKQIPFQDRQNHELLKELREKKILQDYPGVLTETVRKDDWGRLRKKLPKVPEWLEMHPEDDRWAELRKCWALPLRHPKPPS